MSVSFANQLTPNNQPTNQRAVIDNNFVQAIGLPPGTTVANTNSINLQQAVPFPVTEIVNVQIIIGASTGTKNNGNINAVLQATTANTDGTANSAAWANSSFVANPLVIATDNNNTGFAQVQSNIKLSPNELQFIRAQFTGYEASSIPSGKGTIQLLF